MLIEHVDAAESFDGKRDDGLHLLELAHVGEQRGDLPPCSAKRGEASHRAQAWLTSLSTRSVAGSPANWRDRAAPERSAGSGDDDGASVLRSCEPIALLRLYRSLYRSLQYTA